MGLSLLRTYVSALVPYAPTPPNLSLPLTQSKQRVNEKNWKSIKRASVKKVGIYDAKFYLIYIKFSLGQHETYAYIFVYRSLLNQYSKSRTKFFFDKRNMFGSRKILIYVQLISNMLPLCIKNFFFTRKKRVNLFFSIKVLDSILSALRK